MRGLSAPPAIRTYGKAAEVAFLQQLIMDVNPLRVQVFITYDGAMNEMADFLSGYDV
jgi:hypothetical protein